MQKTFQHRWPVWQEEADSSIFVRTQPDDLFGDEYGVEEVPAKKLGDNLYKVCAIPLLVHDINLGDIVRVDTNSMYKGPEFYTYLRIPIRLKTTVQINRLVPINEDVYAEHYDYEEIIFNAGRASSIAVKSVDYKKLVEPTIQELV